MGPSPSYCGHFWPFVPAPDDRWGWLWSIGGMKISRGNRSTRRKPAPTPLCPPTTNPTWSDPGSNPGRRGGKPATNRLSYGAACSIVYKHLKCWCGHRLEVPAYRIWTDWGRVRGSVLHTPNSYMVFPSLDSCPKYRWRCSMVFVSPARRLGAVP
jgi:hypothetical protein